MASEVRIWFGVLVLAVCLPLLSGCAAFREWREEGLAEHDGIPATKLRSTSPAGTTWSLTPNGQDIERNLGVGK